MLLKSHSRQGRKRLGRPHQVPCHWQASLRQDLYLVVTGSVLGSLSASLLVVSQLECPVSFFGAASTSAPPYKADPGHLRHCTFLSPFTTRGSVRGWIFFNPPIPGETLALNMDFRQQSGIIQDIQAHSGNNQGTFREHSPLGPSSSAAAPSATSDALTYSGHIKEHAGNIQRYVRRAHL
jgi:hypothetical protein